jgi:hypothetical protein
MQEKTRLTRHMLFTLSLCIALDHTYLTWSIYNNLSRSHQQSFTVTAPEKKKFLTTSQYTDWLIYGSPSSFSPPHNHRSSGENHITVNNRLIGLLGPYHQHAIGTFNTCSRGPTHRSLTNTGEGYNLGGADLPHHTPQPSQPMVLHFPSKGPVQS